MAHVEVIGPLERMAPSLGGTGYLPPRVSAQASAEELLADVRRSSQHDFNLGMSVWKVSRRSVSWRGCARSRRLAVGNKRIKCEIVGSTRYWYFVAVKCDHVEKQLGK